MFIFFNETRAFINSMVILYNEEIHFMNKNFSPIFTVLLLSIIIGIFTGLISLLFHYTLDFFFKNIAALYLDAPILMLLLPLCVSVIIGLVREFLLHGKNQGFSVSQVMYEIENISYLVMKPLDVIYKLIGTILSLVSGFCVGRQGPLVHIGGAVGSNIAYYFKRSEDETRLLIGCGVAGCLAGSFNAPIFATLFVVEILFKKRYFDIISTILLSSISSTLVVRLILSDIQITNYFESYQYNMSEIINFVILGIIVGFISIIYTFVLRKTNKIFKNMKLSYIQKSLIGGLTIGLSLMYLSTIYSYNINPIEMLNSDRSIAMLLLTVITYIILTAVSVGSGSMGGIFTPGLFIGAASGLVIGKTLKLFGFGILNTQTYAIAGMAAMFSGFAIAPLSGALLVIEITGQYNLIFPILVATLSSSMLTELLLKESIYHHNLNDLLVGN